MKADSAGGLGKCLVCYLMKRETDNPAVFFLFPFLTWNGDSSFHIFQPFHLEVAQGLGEHTEGRSRTG